MTSPVCLAIYAKKKTSNFRFVHGNDTIITVLPNGSSPYPQQPSSASYSAYGQVTIHRRTNPWRLSPTQSM